MRIALLGDIALYGKYSISNSEVYSYFRDVATKLKEFDYVVGNLETPLCTSCKAQGYKSAFIKAAEENVKLLKYLNVGITNLANNHIFDYGINGYQSTKKVLEENGIKYFGIENKQLKIEKDDTKVVFSGYCCYSTNGLGYFDPKTQIGVNILDCLKVEKTLIESYKEGYLNIISFHIGQEHVNYPNYDHVEMARFFSQCAPYVFYGHHPHVIQGIEEVNNSILAYSLGNFCFDDVYTNKSKEPLVKQSEENKKSLILSLEIRDNKVIKYDAIPLYADKGKLQVGTHTSILQDLKYYSKFLSVDKKQYIIERTKIINKYINARKKKRDLVWYIKRLNLNSVGMIVNAKYNKKKYRKYITEYLKINSKLM